MEIVIFDGELRLGDSVGATMVFAQDFRVQQCAGAIRKLTILCAGVEILGAEDDKEVSAHSVYLDHTWVGRLTGNMAELTTLPSVEAGTHRVSIHVSPFPGFGVCDDFTLRKVVFTCG
ncbi:MAG: hypothetical protein K0Q72_3456 [Armatimonadetes bacterium]|jgi:hypothetical protein|nr:hypothetical protein [Armatimonadota bacterium]